MVLVGLSKLFVGCNRMRGDFLGILFITVDIAVFYVVAGFGIVYWVIGCLVWGLFRIGFWRKFGSFMSFIEVDSFWGYSI